VHTRDVSGLGSSTLGCHLHCSSFYSGHHYSLDQSTADLSVLEDTHFTVRSTPLIQLSYRFCGLDWSSIGMVQIASICQRKAQSSSSSLLLRRLVARRQCFSNMLPASRACSTAMPPGVVIHITAFNPRSRPPSRLHAAASPRRPQLSSVLIDGAFVPGGDAAGYLKEDGVELCSAQTPHRGVCTDLWIHSCTVIAVRALS
jgi:hypothetical protein